MSSPEPDRAARRWRAGAVSAAVLAVAAVLALGGWALGRPAPSTGDGLAALGPGPAASTPVAGTPSARPSPEGPAPTPSVSATARPADPAATRARTSAPPPTRLRIPELGVDATVRAVGVQDDGAMVIPAAPTTVGWYRYGSAPDDPTGHTVIAGHVATRKDGPGALAPLAGAEAGMRVEVVDADGTTHRYVVRGREAVRKKALPLDRIFTREGAPLLVLVTCGGEYVPRLRSHLDNVVVTAEPLG